MPAAKLRPVRPRTTARPPVMYSQPWSPTPSTTARGARVAHREALAREPAEERAAGRRAVEHGVADDDVLLGLERRVLGRADGQHAAGQALAGVVVGVAEQRQLDARRQPRAERLPGASRAACSGSSRGGSPAAPWTFVTALESRPPTVRLTLRTSKSPVTGIRWSIASRAASISVQSSAPGQRRVLRAHAPARRVVGDRRRGQHVREVDAAALPVLDRRVGLEQVDAADEILVAADAEPAHDLPRLLGDEEEEVHDVLGLALEALAQLRVLRRDAHRARVQVAGAHHDAARRDQRGGGEAALVGAEQRGDHDVAAGLELAVGLDPDARAQVVEHERLLGLGEADLPRDAGRLDASSAATRRCRRRGRRSARGRRSPSPRPPRPCRRRPRDTSFTEIARAPGWRSAGRRSAA